MGKWKRPTEYAELLDVFEGNDLWELANNEGTLQADQLIEALDLLAEDRDGARGPAWEKRRDGLLRWAQTATGFGGEPEGG